MTNITTVNADAIMLPSDGNDVVIDSGPLVFDGGPPSSDAGVIPPLPKRQVRLAGGSIPQFATQLPVLSVANGSITTVTGNQALTIRMCEFWANVLPAGTFVPGVQPKTRVWGYIAGNGCPPNGPDDPALDTYVGPVIISARNNAPAHARPPTTVTWVNELGTTATTQLLAYRLSTDQTLHWADPLGHELNACEETETAPAFGSLCAANYAGPIPAVVHLHGGEVPAAIDGNPDAWFLSQAAPGYSTHGHAYYSRPGTEAANSATYAYPNTQQAAPLWFHDHTLGATRLNVYAGLAGAYLVTDPELPLPAGLTATGLRGPNDQTTATIPLVVQTRMFDINGQLLYPGTSTRSVDPRHPRWTPEAFGDTVVVNGKVWPSLSVEPRRYRFLLINGSDSSAFDLTLGRQGSNGAARPPMWVIATDAGYLDTAVEVNTTASGRFVMMPGERYDVIIDFTSIAPGTDLILRNAAPSPFPMGEPPDEATVGRVMQFRVVGCASGACGARDPGFDPATGTPLRTNGQRIVRFANSTTGRLDTGATVARRRVLTLNERISPPSTATDPITGAPNTMYPGGPLEMLLNNTEFVGESIRPYRDFVAVDVNGASSEYSELPQEGDAELWEIVNLTADAHPIHTHLTSMQILNRQGIDRMAYEAAYDAAFPAAVIGGVNFPGGMLIPGFGPPLDYNTGNPSALGGNPDIAPFLRGAARPPERYEAGWKDTVIMRPDEVTRVIVRFAPSSLPIDAPAASRVYPFDPSAASGYVWHCHVLSHEDNEMMRPFRVIPNPAAPVTDQRPLLQGRNY